MNWVRMLKIAEGLQCYCMNGRIPTSNMRADYVAKSIAIARNNFLFANTPAGAGASERIFSVTKTARAYGHFPQPCLRVLLTELPNVNDVEALLPWYLTPAQIDADHARRIRDPVATSPNEIRHPSLCRRLRFRFGR